MPSVRTFIVDDSIVVRRALARILTQDPEIELAGVASSGREALERIDINTPDVVLMDVVMPVMSGLETLKALRCRHPSLPVIMFSALTERGAATTVEALLSGASDYVPKPSAQVGGIGLEEAGALLIEKIKALCPANQSRRTGTLSAAPPRPTRPRPPSGRVEAVVIAVSTGGPRALEALLPALPGSLPVPILIVQHMPAFFTRSLAERLDLRSNLEITEGAAGEVVRPGCAYIAPGGLHMEVEHRRGRTIIKTHEGPAQNSCRPAADALFCAAAALYGSGVLAVVLTGMGKDSLRGCRAIKKAGGQVIIQDEATSVVWGMPGAVAGAGLHDRILPLDAIAGAIVTRVTPSAPKLSANGKK